ncbi:hypothetical protein RISK_003690 [Rhodopirellula islandica]|uniref:Uncharacterized protein n=1 Tax=Rhodopirellula islandica TaxID=595434 RepID=A0A0J1EEZ7_RHOIS|nr:hypothetical protein RISK_003690 [Rhodopirellula islandica]
MVPATMVTALNTSAFDRARCTFNSHGVTAADEPWVLTQGPQESKQTTQSRSDDSWGGSY